MFDDCTGLKVELLVARRGNAPRDGDPQHTQLRVLHEPPLGRDIHSHQWINKKCFLCFKHFPAHLLRGIQIYNLNISNILRRCKDAAAAPQSPIYPSSLETNGHFLLHRFTPLMNNSRGHEVTWIMQHACFGEKRRLTMFDEAAAQTRSLCCSIDVQKNVEELSPSFMLSVITSAEKHQSKELLKLLCDPDPQRLIGVF